MENTFSLTADLQGKQITRLQLDNAFAMLCEEGSLITIEADFKLVTNEQERFIQTSKVDDLAYALLILHSEIMSIEIKASALLIEFRHRKSGKLELEVQPSEQYEAWQIYVASKEQYICMPSGDIAIFPSGNTAF